METRFKTYDVPKTLGFNIRVYIYDTLMKIYSKKENHLVNKKKLYNLIMDLDYHIMNKIRMKNGHKSKDRRYNEYMINKSKYFKDKNLIFKIGEKK